MLAPTEALESLGRADVILTDSWCTGPPSSNLLPQLFIQEHPPLVFDNDGDQSV